MKRLFSKSLFVFSTFALTLPFANANTESSVSTLTYPKANVATFVGTDISKQSLPNIPMVNLQVSQVVTIPTVFINATITGSQRLDVSMIDDFIATASPNARHYPPVFNNRTERYNTIQRVKALVEWLDVYAQDKNASYDVLLRATKLNAMARNLDLGSEYAVRASDYVVRAIKLNDTGEANFLYGAMLSEGGGFQEGAKFLLKAEKMGFAEATQSLAQIDLLEDNRPRALQRLNEFKTQYPNNPYIDKQLEIVNSGKFYIWDILISPK